MIPPKGKIFNFALPYLSLGPNISRLYPQRKSREGNSTKGEWLRNELPDIGGFMNLQIKQNWIKSLKNSIEEGTQKIISTPETRIWDYQYLTLKPGKYRQAPTYAASSEVGTNREIEMWRNKVRKGGEGCLREYIHTRMAVHEDEKEFKELKELGWWRDILVIRHPAVDGHLSSPT